MRVTLSNSRVVHVVQKRTKTWYLVQRTDSIKDLRRVSTFKSMPIEYDDTRTDGKWFWIRDPYFVKHGIKTVLYYGKFYSVEDWGREVRKDSQTNLKLNRYVNRPTHVWCRIQVKELSDEDVSKLDPEFVKVITDYATKDKNAVAYFE